MNCETEGALLDIGHVFADLGFVAFGLVIAVRARILWRQPTALPRLDETPDEAFFRGYYIPAKKSMVAGGPWFASIGLFAFAMQLEESVRNNIVKDFVWIPYYLFLASAIFWGMMFFFLFFAGRPRALVPPAFRDS